MSYQVLDHQGYIRGQVQDDGKVSKIINFKGQIIGSVSEKGEVFNHQGYIFGKVPSAPQTLAGGAALILLLTETGQIVRQKTT